MEEVLLEVKYSLDVALAWCLNAKYSLLNSYGYSPNQLVFGYNPSFPSVLNNQLPAQNGVTSSELIASHLNSLHAARKRFIETEVDEKLQRAHRHKTITATSLVYQNGDQVYYKKNDSQYWKGPATVIGIDNKQVFIRHGGIYVRVNTCNLQLVNDSVKNVKWKLDKDSPDVQNYSKEKQNINTDVIIEVDTENVSNKFEEQKDKESKERQVNELTDMISQLELNNESVNPTKASGIVPAIKSKVTYEDPDSREWKRTLVISRADKASGKNKYWFNIKDLYDNTIKSLDFENICS